MRIRAFPVSNSNAARVTPGLRGVGPPPPPPPPSRPSSTRRVLLRLRVQDQLIYFAPFVSNAPDAYKHYPITLPRTCTVINRSVIIPRSPPI